MKPEGEPSLRQSASYLDPLPATHPLSQKLRSIFESTATFASTSESNKNALLEIEERYKKHDVEESRKKKSASTRRIRNAYSDDIDTERARNSLARDAQDSLEKACFGFLDSLEVVDDVSSVEIHSKSESGSIVTHILIALTRLVYKHYI
jgi:hypothetical protein